MFLFNDLLLSQLFFFWVKFNLFQGKTSPQQHGEHKLRVPLSAGLSYRDNVPSGEAAEQRRSLRADEDFNDV